MKSIHTTSTRKADYIIPDCIEIAGKIERMWNKYNKN